MDNGKIATPLKWLLAELPDYIDPAPLLDLMERYRLHTVAYTRQVAIAKVERTIKEIQRRNRSEGAAKLARWHAKLAKLSGGER